MEDDVYEELIKVIEAAGKTINTKVTYRTALQRNAVARYYRYLKKYQVTASNGRIYLNGRILLRRSELSNVVKKVVHLSKGTSAKYAAKRIAISSVGASCKVVKKLIDAKKKVIIHTCICISGSFFRKDRHTLWT